MALEPLATPEDLGTVVRMAPSDPRVRLALRRASGRFRDAVGYPVSRVTDDVLTRMCEGGGTLFLKGAPATVTSVVLDGTELVAGTDYRVDPEAGILYRVGGCWPAGALAVVTYTHGYEEVPEGVEDAVLEHAATIAKSLAHVQQETAGTNNASYAQAATVGTTQKWVDAVEAYRLRGRA